MATNYIYVICKGCGGDGKHPDATVDGWGNPSSSGEKDCTACNGEGSYLWATLEDELRGEE